MRSGSIRSPRDFQQVYARGRRVRSGALTVFVYPREDDGPARLGLAVPARRRGAVARNRMRRRLREAFARCDESGVDVVVRTQPEVSLSFQELVLELCRSIARGRRP